MTSEGKLIVASTRLPITLQRKGERWESRPSAGGLVTALAPVAEQSGFEWFGWPGTSIPDADRNELSGQLAAAGYHPVFLSKADIEGFYEGFSNRVLWPLFHGLTDLTSYRQHYFRAYRAVNERFADAIAAAARSSDSVWIHDYQLCLVPQLLRQRGVTCPIGFFLHIPFPSSEIYRTLPVREAVLRGLLGADYLGFHAYEYVSHFRKSCLRVLGLDSQIDAIRVGSRKVVIGVQPIGIDPAEVRDLTTSREASDELVALKAAYSGKKLIIGVDRLDYTKGIVEKLLAFEELLRAHPKYRKSCVLLQIAAPSRENVDEYQALKRKVAELVGNINGRYGSPSHTPVVYVNQSVTRARLAGMYQAADIALVTPIRDGMNLVAMEYIAARGRQGGSLILSEFAGAAYLLPGARLVNPYNSTQVARVLAEELANQRPDSTHMLDFINENTSQRWADRCLKALEATREEEHPSAIRLRVNDEPARSRLAQAKRPIVFLDYDGTLRGYESKPMAAAPTPRIRSVLRELAAYATVYVVSGRPGDTLEQWLGELPIGLVCEHGLAIREHGGKWRQRFSAGLGALERVMTLFEEYCRRTPGASIESKQASIAWHYRSAEPELATIQARELLNELEEVLRGHPYSVLRGNKVVEVRPSTVTKGHAVAELLALHADNDVVFCAGDDRTDEDMMNELNESECRRVLCWVGAPSRAAEFWVDSSEALLAELADMVHLWAESRGAPPPRLRRN